MGEVGAGTNPILMTVTFTVAVSASPGDTPLMLSYVNASSDPPQLFTPTATKGTITRFSVPIEVSNEMSGRVITSVN